MPHICGIQPVKEALSAGQTIVKAWLSKGSVNENIRSLIREFKNKNIPFQYVPQEKLRKLSGGRNHQGIVVLVTDVVFQPLDEVITRLFEQGKNPFLLILDKITDVRNFGSLAHTAECLGVHALIIPMQGNAPVNEDAIRTSAGALIHIPVCREANLKQTLEYLKDCGIQTVAIHEKTNKNIFDFNFTEPVALLLGNEEKGISPAYLKFCTAELKIPMEGKTSSLNVANAASMAIYEVMRQRHAK